MNNGSGIMKKKILYFITLAIFVLIVSVYFIPVPQSGTKSVQIVSNVSVSQGAAQNDTEIDIVKVHGIFFNDGDVIAKNLTASVIFTDTTHNEVVRKTVKEGVDLIPDKGTIVEFDSEYSRKKTIPKTEVKVTIQFEWMENGHLKTTKTFVSSGGPDSSDKENNDTHRFIYGNATVESIEIISLESFPVQIKVNARGYLPDGCTRIQGITKEKKENTFFVTIRTVRPADAFCTQAIVPFQEMISLDVYGFKAGIYTVDVNGVKGTFELETDNII
ncbi:MAG TPA: hypothetical protein VN368_01060 [Candidatus Methylomirabilis sp.]|nr:hypothetical protein [Candidatus Methylomirabilis sp.]